eukprot:670296-Rhodomonas_salina.2
MTHQDLEDKIRSLEVQVGRGGRYRREAAFDRWQTRSAIFLRARYAMPGTDVAHAFGTIPGTDLAFGATSLDGSAPVDRACPAPAPSRPGAALVELSRQCHSQPMHAVPHARLTS